MAKKKKGMANEKKFMPKKSQEWWMTIDPGLVECGASIVNINTRVVFDCKTIKTTSKMRKPYRFAYIANRLVCMLKEFCEWSGDSVDGIVYERFYPRQNNGAQVSELIGAILYAFEYNEYDNVGFVTPSYAKKFAGTTGTADKEPVVAKAFEVYGDKMLERFKNRAGNITSHQADSLVIGAALPTCGYTKFIEVDQPPKSRVRDSLSVNPDSKSLI